MAKAFNASSSAIKLFAALNRTIDVFIKGELLIILTAFFRVMLTRVVYQQAAHYLGGNAKKMGAILPVNARLIHQV